MTASPEPIVEKLRLTIEERAEKIADSMWSRAATACWAGAKERALVHFREFAQDCASDADRDFARKLREELACAIKRGRSMSDLLEEFAEEGADDHGELHDEDPPRTGRA